MQTKYATGKGKMFLAAFGPGHSSYIDAQLHSIKQLLLLTGFVRKQ